ncbi:hypothetical protein WICMUC_003034 [Wickerhamomyces mucosus]|uniref:Glycerophosphocholine acyltransferase 1 n=1 Tax=Wickerhamomyces mucosus TaxID=1378264 RepID=A0A9P8PMM5_9ASCO|nr:hypothetical protein WICMUC_003034 [Wickerhamomyces mucosus]
MPTISPFETSSQRANNESSYIESTSNPDGSISLSNKTIIDGSPIKSATDTGEQVGSSINEINDGNASIKTSRTYSNSSVATTVSGSPLFYSSGYYNNSIETFPTEKISLLDILDPLSTTSPITKKYHQVKERSINRLNKIRDGTSKRREQYLNEFKDIDGLKRKLAERVEKLDKRLNNLFYASATEKCFYSLAVYNLFISGYMIGTYPQYFHIFYTALTGILLPIRIYTFWKKSFHYFLADLCYYVNGLVLVFIWIVPNSKHLYMVCFAFTFGTLSWAVVTWRNSLVLHSIDKTTSSFIHVMPPVVMYVITHQLPHDFKSRRFPAAVELITWNFFSGIIWTSFYYLIWQAAYHYFITIRKAQKIKEGRVTSFEWLRKSFSNKWIGKFVNGLPGPFPVIAFTLIQYGYQLLTMSICPLFFAYKQLASLFITFIFLVATYNGATYYVDYYGRRLEKEVARLQKEISELQSADDHDIYEDPHHVD